MEKNWILVMDSGSGGEYTLKKLQEVLPSENYLFFMDKTHCPYGRKSATELKKICHNAISLLTKKFNIKLVVLACNTLSSTAGDYIKQEFAEIPILCVTPQITPEILKKPTLILATKATVKHNKTIREIRHSKNVFVFGFADLAKKIDSCNKNYDSLQPYLNKKLKRFQHKFLDNVVLGCTHFNYIKPQIQVALKAKVDFFENSENIALEAKKLLLATSAINKKKSAGEVLTFYSVT
jgi:glutamate racemase